MLYIITSDYKTIHWHVGERVPASLYVLNNVTELQASDDELEYIYRHFENIPKAKHQRVTTWFGNIAKFIASNL